MDFRVNLTVLRDRLHELATGCSDDAILSVLYSCLSDQCKAVEVGLDEYLKLDSGYLLKSIEKLRKENNELTDRAVRSEGDADYCRKQMFAVQVRMDAAILESKRLQCTVEQLPKDADEKVTLPVDAEADCNRGSIHSAAITLMAFKGGKDYGVAVRHVVKWMIEKNVGDPKHRECALAMVSHREVLNAEEGAACVDGRYSHAEALFVHRMGVTPDQARDILTIWRAYHPR